MASAQKTTHFPRSGLARPVTYETTKLSHTTIVTRATMPTRSWNRGVLRTLGVTVVEPDRSGQHHPHGQAAAKRSSSLSSRHRSPVA